jgi:hypothetical protein
MWTMSVEDQMPIEVARALLTYKRGLSEPQWLALKTAYRRARGSFAAPIALRIAEDAVFKKPSTRPRPV